jgi:hypothetical protein
MLEVVVIGLKRPKGYGELHGDIGLQNCALREYLKNSHILSI